MLDFAQEVTNITCNVVANFLAISTYVLAI